jgi:hypothetical protein
MALTIAYVTARKECQVSWFFDSLAKQLRPEHEIEILVVDRYCETDEDRCDEMMGHAAGALMSRLDIPVQMVPPKPNVWNGKYRLTSQDWFAAASHRNTAICLCKTPHIAFVDDLSVLMPGWLDAAFTAVAGNYVGCGAYRKVRNLVVKDGAVVSYEQGTDDDRLSLVTQDVSPCTGGWLYGCSLVAPLEDLLEVGGFPEYCDGLGSEDYCLGIALSNAGKHLKYDRRLMTLESEELHFVEPAMKRTDKGVSPNDKSHAALRIAQGSRYFPNYYEGGIRALRDHVLGGGEFPTAQVPDRDWFDGQLIAEM